MFAAGRKQQVAQEQPKRDDAVANADDWLQVGASFVQEPRRDHQYKERDATAESSALQVYRKSDRKSKKKKSDSSSRKAERRKSHKRLRSESDSGDSNNSSSSSAHASDDDGKQLVRCRDRHLKKKRDKIDKKKKSASSRRRRHDSSSNSESESDATSHRRSHKRSKERKHKRLRASEQHTDKYNQLVAAAPKEVQVWMKQTAVDDLDTNGAKLFEFDCVGDRENRFYGTLYAQDKPLYALATRRNVFTGEWLVERKKNGVPGHRNDDKTKTAKDAGSEHRYFGTSARQMEKDSRQRRLYLAYSEKRLARQQQQRTADSGSAVATELAYIPLDPVINPNLNEGDDSEEMQSLRTEIANIEQYLVTKSKIFNESLQKTPRNIDMWLDFIAFQEQSLRLTRRKANSNSSSSSTMVTDRQVAILEKAIKANPGDRELQLVKLNLSIRNLNFGNSNSTGVIAVRGDHETLRNQLEEMIERDPTNGDLWGHLLRTSQQNFASFSVSLLRDLYARIITVLRKETMKVVAQEEDKLKSQFSTTSQSSTLSSSSVRIFDSGSLLASSSSSFAVSFDSVVATSEEAQELVHLLLDFHVRMCALEQKVGYAERAIAQMQALIDFNLTTSTTYGNGGGSSSEHHHTNMLQEFTVRWNQNLPHFGDEVSDSATAAKFSLKYAYLPSSSALTRIIYGRIAIQLSSMNPSESVQSREHQQSLLVLASTNHRTRERFKRLRTNGEDDDGDNGDRMDEDGTDDDKSLDGKLTYSNVHGYRIKLDEIDDASEYERILSELRGTRSSITKQESQVKKQEKQKAKITTSMAKFHDERVDYDTIDAHDTFVEWLKHEETKEATQWIPLRSTDPLHQELIDESPDRAVLTEEIHPFLFRVPRAFRLTMALSLLKFVGVQWLNNTARQPSTMFEDVYADNFDEYEELVAPILSALDPNSSESILLSPLQRRDLLQHELLDGVRVTKPALIDPSKVAFIRNVLARLLDIVHKEGDRKSMRLVKYLWIEFEAYMVSRTDQKEEDKGGAGLQFARQLCQQLMESDGAPGTDVALMFAYAKLEQQAGNARQMNRICDKTILSLDLHSYSDAKMDRSFHALIFLRTRNEVWNVEAPKSDDSIAKSSIDEELRKLKLLYILWSIWQDQQQEWDSLDKLEKQFRKQPVKLKKHLEKLVNTVEVKTALVEKYRVELEIATQQHIKQSNSSSGGGISSMGTSVNQNDWLWSVGYCAHNLCLAIYATSGFQASCNEYQSLIQERESSSAQRSLCRHQNRWLRLCYLEFVQQHQLSYAFPIVAPRYWRHAIGSAVTRFPHNPLLLRLYVDAETSNTMSQSLRRHFQSVRTRWQRHFDSPLVVEWLFALLCEFSRLERSVSNASWQSELEVDSSLSSQHPSRSSCCLFHKFGSNLTGVDRVRRIFQDMAESMRTQGNALCWRLYLRFEVQCGKIDTARRVFYRGLAKCPWSKALYLDGVRVLRPYLSDGECKELVEFMAAKELHVREEEED